MSFVCCQIDLAVKNLFICFHKDAHLLRRLGLDDLLRIYNQGHNQCGSAFTSFTLLEEGRAGNPQFLLQNRPNSLLYY